MCYHSGDRVDLEAIAMKEYSVFPKAQLTGASPSGGSMSFPGHLLGESYSSAEMQLVYTAAPADWAGRE